MTTKQTIRRTTRRPPFHRAFTLTELMVAIVIIMILVAILAPTVVRVQTLAKVAQTQTIINALSGACNLYHVEFNYYPDDNETYVNGNRTSIVMQGRHRLAQSLLGFRTDSSKHLETGNGWRLQTRGTLYDANFFGVTDLPTGAEDPTKPVANNNPLNFKDSFGRNIYYYVKRNTSGTTIKYEPNDNNADDGKPKPTDAYLNNGITGGTAFLLLSRGPNGTWDPAGQLKDDVTNFPRPRK